MWADAIYNHFWFCCSECNEDVEVLKVKYMYIHTHAYTTALATGNVKMKHVCFRTKCVCFSSAKVGVVFSLSLEIRRKSLLVPKALVLYTPWYTKGFMISCTLCLRRKRYSSVSRPGISTAY